MEETAPAVKIDDVTVLYQQVPALLSAQVEIPSGTRTAIVGPNGAGKSTLFKSILGLEPIQSGNISLFGVSQQQEKRLYREIVAKKVAYIPQHSVVNEQFPATVFDIVLMGRYPHINNMLKRPNASDKEIALHALEQMKVVDLRNRHITELSGGQRQRVFIARALAQEAKIYLMDEPLAGIDVVTEQLIMDTLKLFQKEGKTSIVIHHDIHTIPHYFDYLVWLNKRVVQAGVLETVFNYENYHNTYQLTGIKDTSDKNRMTSTMIFPQSFQQNGGK